MHFAPGGESFEIEVFRQHQTVVEGHAWVPYGAVHLRVTRVQLNGSEISCLPVFLRYLRSSHRMGAKGTCLKAKTGDPFPNVPSILPGLWVWARMQSARPQKL